jgi:tetratricopeptide (TPR) repeat protein
MADEQPVWFAYRRSFWLKIGIALVILIVACFAAKPAYRRYLNWRAASLAAKSSALLAKGDIQAAALVSQQALQLAPYNPAANWAMALICARLGDPNAMLFWQAATQLAPDRKDFQLGFAQTALSFGQHEVAQGILDKLRPEMENNPVWLNLASGCAIARQDFAAGTSYLERLRQLEPNQERHRLNQASVGLLSLRLEMVDNALKELEALAKNPALAREAMRNLAVHYRKTGQAAKSISYWDRLSQIEPLSWEEKLDYLDLIKIANPARAQALLQDYDQAARTNALGQFALGSWYLRNTTPQQTLALLAAAKADLRQSQLYFLVAEAYIQLNRWDLLDRHLHQPTISTLEFLRFALMALSDKQQGRLSAYQMHWLNANRMAASHISQQLRLAELAQRWGWQGEVINLWWDIARGTNAPAIGLQRLGQHYLNLKDRRSLRQVLEQMNKLYPEDLVVANDLAMLDLVFQENLPRAHQLAQQTYQKGSNQVAFVATYGLSLYFQGKPAEARKLYETISAHLNHPSLQLNYGMMLAATGETNRARQILSSLDAKSLSPEERQWLAQTQAKLAHR